MELLTFELEFMMNALANQKTINTSCSDAIIIGTGLICQHPHIDLNDFDIVKLYGPIKTDPVIDFLDQLGKDVKIFTEINNIDICRSETVKSRHTDKPWYARYDKKKR